MFITRNNFLSLLPYVFTASRHISFTLILGLGPWLGYMVYRSLKNTSTFFAHLVPRGTPKVLIPFIVLIESVRIIIRPLTLAVRLAANIIAGHLLLVLCSAPSSTSGVALLSIIIIRVTALTVLETGVSVIQRYVFISLSCLYVGEVNSCNL